MGLKSRIKELAAKSESVWEFARGDYMISHMKRNPNEWFQDWRAEDTIRAAKGRFDRASEDAIKDVMERGGIFGHKAPRVVSDFVKEGGKQMQGSRNNIAKWLRSRRSLGIK